MPADYYSVGFDFSRYGVSTPDDERIEASLKSMAQTGIKEARVTFSWNEMEPFRTGIGHTYVFQNFDRWVRMAAAEGIRTQAMFGYAPAWATDSEFCKQALGGNSARPTDIFSWRLAVAAFVDRYGKDGDFWDEHPDLPDLPITSFEIWNEQNIQPYWCPTPQPEVYGTYLDVAEQEISARSPSADVISGGMPVTTGRHPNTAIAPAQFLTRMLSAVPSLSTRLDGIGIHPYAFGARSRQLEVIADFREALQAAGVPDSTPMLISEIGFSTEGPQAVTEQERAERYEEFTTQIPRSNCNVSGISAHTWVSRETGDKTDPWFGISSPATGQPYPTATAYGHSIALMRGELPQEPPKSAIMNCPGMPALDRDDDGVPDRDDAFPLDPTRSEEEDGGGGGGGNDAHKCTTDLIRLRALVATTSGAEQRKAVAKHRRASRRCVPCEKKISRLSKRINDADGSAANLKKRRSALRRRCAPCMNRLETLQENALLISDPDLIEALLARHDKVLVKCKGTRR